MPSSSLTAPLFMTTHKRPFNPHESSVANNSKHGTVRDDDDDDNVFTSKGSNNGANAPKRAPKRRAASSATHELRLLREETALLQYQLDSLKLKWRRLGVDSDLLSRACDAALAKRESKRAFAVNKQFKAQLLQQQLFFASIQSLMLSDCPLLQVLRAKDVFECLHLPLRLPANGSASNKARKTKLDTHCETSLRLAPAVMNRFAHAHVDKASTSVPFSHTSIMGDTEFTYVASVFVCKLRNLSVEQVFNAATAYSETLPLELKRCLGIDVEIEDDDNDNDNEDTNEELPKPSLVHKRQRTWHSRMGYCNKGSGVTSTQDSVFAAQLTEHRAVVLSDFVDQDDNDKDANGLKREVETTSAIVITAMQDKETGEHQVLLQRLFVNRYALPATSRKLHDDVKSTTALLNGDLLMAVMCRELQSQVVH